MVASRYSVDRRKPFRRLRKDIETTCEDRTRRSAKGVPSIGASPLRRRRRYIETLCEDETRRSANEIQSIGADISRLSRNIAMNCAAGPQRSPGATSQLFCNPWGPNTQASPRNFPPTQQLLLVQPHCRICFARINHNGGAIPSFGHFVCAIRPRPHVDIRTRNTVAGECGTRSKPEKSWDANLGTQNLERIYA